LFANSAINTEPSNKKRKINERLNQKLHYPKGDKAVGVSRDLAYQYSTIFLLNGNLCGASIAFSFAKKN
jgi:hypothetical protein